VAESDDNEEDQDPDEDDQQEDEELQVPAGFEVMEALPLLDDTLVGSNILMYWKFNSGRGKTFREWGEWHLGTVKGFYGPKNAPKRMLKYNYTVSFDDSDRDVMLAADGYDVDPKAHIPKKVNIWVCITSQK